MKQLSNEQIYLEELENARIQMGDKVVPLLSSDAIKKFVINALKRQEIQFSSIIIEPLSFRYSFKVFENGKIEKVQDPENGQFVEYDELIQWLKSLQK